MSILVTCESCASTLRVSENVLGKRVRCPKCKEIFVAREAKESSEEPANNPDFAVTTSPGRRKASEEEAPEMDVEESDEEDEERPRKKKKKPKKKKSKPSFLMSLLQSPSFGWWAFGGGGVFAFMIFLLCLAIFSGDNAVRAYAGYLCIMMPISTVIFFVAMYLSSVWFGAIEIGELHIAAVKAFILVTIVNLVSLIPGGFIFTFIVYFAGIIMLFRLDVWEARILIAINWVLNLGVRILLLGLFISWATHGGLDDRFDDRRPAGQNAVWDIGDIEGLGGQVQFNDANEDDDAVVGISFKGGQISNAQLAQMKDFPRLERLDLTNLPITDRGVLQLRECRRLRSVNLTGTHVTEEGAAALQKAMPGLQIRR